MSKLFEFAGAAEIAPTADAYKQYFAQLQAGYTASKATDFGQFMMGLQKGGTAYMTMGGTLEEAISTFAAARSVMANEALAATLVEQVARLSGGGYEKPRTAMEEALGVTWSDMGMDERTAALIEHVRRIPDAQRAQTLAEQGFPMELTTQIGKMVSPEAMRTMESTRRVVTNAIPAMIETLTQAYLDSMLSKEHTLQAEISGKEFAAGPAFASWQRRLRTARKEFDVLMAKGQDKFYADQLEPYMMALTSMRDELDSMMGDMPDAYREQAEDLRWRMSDYIKWWRYRPLLSVGDAEKRAAVLEYRLTELREATGGGPAFPQERLPGEPPSSPPQPTPISPPPFDSRPTQPTPTPPPPSDEPLVVNNFDHRVINYTIHNPVAGINKQDLGIEPPRLSV